MNIHLIRTHYPHWGEHSGIHQFVKYLDPQKYKVEMRLASDSDADFPIQRREIQGILRRAVQSRGMQWYKLSDLTAEVNAWRKGWAQKVDIVHYLDGEHSAQFLPTLCKLLPRQRPKLIANYHQPPDLLDSLVDQKIIPQLDAIIVVSPEQVSYFNRLTDPDRVHLILHGIDVDYFKPDESAKRDERCRCITVGKYLRDFHALRQVAEMLSSDRRVEFHVVSSEASEVEELENVTVYQGIDDAKLLALYQQSDILFLPLIQSTANNALLEGIACGLPVISTELTSVRAYLSGKESILIENNLPGRFAEAILHLADNQAERQRMGQEARRRAMELDWRCITSAYQKIYLQLMNSSKTVAMEH
jgi:glycosyltransferase involved in cell wall biosynthesis